MPITKTQLADKLFQIRQEYSNRPDLNPETARREMADKEAQAINDFVIGRLTTVTGTSATGGAVTGTGTIQ
ncbi:conserved hypothetical protein [Tenacibaculum maritimum]|uniref:hypothetical protein n=1 Tax=Tenacibaculum maritimum TaxID=107401 RepID=UPI0012E65873|nr:hypothetical protein [Tenacibaculum maritimum]MCD9582277.1 hypothetical protein [Tenacibaculum maritimum]MCD9636659.1 hypothetical protein [Tenacibaculum maritimum]CAA0144719.1 conserved hypothetical protein [Tenacibaculum maritimum]CAA0193581.1 conserved hypothetical protein [Tenacibaculum maritimum]